MRIKTEMSNYDLSIPEFYPIPQEITKLLFIDCELKMKEVTDHIDKEILRFKTEVERIKNDNRV